MGGMWCGNSWGPVMFYSETRSLILTVKLFKWVVAGWPGNTSRA